MNITSTVMFMIWMILYYSKYAINLDNYREEVKSSVIIQRMRDDDSWNYKVSIALPVALQFARLVYALQVNRTFGPMVKIISSMIVDVMRFLVLFAVLFFIFVGSGQILFAELDAYADLEEAMKTLFASSIGEFDYGTYDNLKDVSPQVGYIFITWFLLIASIMLLNFLIAILSTTYSMLNDVKNGLYMRKVIQYRQRYNYDSSYSAIVFAPVPLNIIMIPFLPILFLTKNENKVNEVLMIWEYFLIAVAATLLFLASSLVFTPITYLIILLAKFKHIFNKPVKNCKDIMVRILDFLAFIFIGIFFILFWVMIDTVSFSIKLFSKRIMLIDKEQQEKQMMINEQMDGSLKKSAADLIGKDPISPIPQPTFRAKGGNKGLNPLKEGLSDTTFKIVKAWCSLLLENHQEDINNHK